MQGLVALQQGERVRLPQRLLALLRTLHLALTLLQAPAHLLLPRPHLHHLRLRMLQLRARHSLALGGLGEGGE